MRPHLCISSIKHGNWLKNSSRQGQWGIKQHLLTSYLTQSMDILPGCCLSGPSLQQQRQAGNSWLPIPTTKWWGSKASTMDTHTVPWPGIQKQWNRTLCKCRACATVSSAGRGHHHCLNTCREMVHDLVAVLGGKRCMKNMDLSISVFDAFFRPQLCYIFLKRDKRDSCVVRL